MKSAKLCSDLIIANKEAIIQEWEKEVREKISGAGISTTIMLRNELPDLLDDFAEILLEKGREGYINITDEYVQTIEKNTDHGKLRSKSENYSVDQVIREYYILHRIITELLQKHEALTVDVANVLKYLFEMTMMRVSASFVQSIHEMQEKLIGTLIHDIRNPLSASLTSIDYIAENTKGVEPFIEVVKNSIQRSIDLTEKMLDTISIKSGEGLTMNFVEGDFAIVVREAYDEASKTYSNPFECNIPKNSISGNFDPTAIRRLTDNLISNAVKYGHPGSPITIGLLEKGSNVILTITNQGDPIPTEKQQAIFNFLGKGDEAHHSRQKSWGMGLALVKLVANAHEGSAECTSNKEEGTTFAVTLKKNSSHFGKVRMKS